MFGGLQRALIIGLQLVATAALTPAWAGHAWSSSADTRSTTVGAPAGTETPSVGGFVKASGTQLVLDGKPYRFTGMNIYMAASGGTPSSCGGELYPNLEVPLSHMPDGIVIRFWAFQRFFVSQGAFDWRHFHEVLQIAAAHHDKLIPVLTNEHAYCDGAVKTAYWYRKGYREVQSGDLVSYRRYASRVVRHYSNNRTIAMWQLVNEAQAVSHDGTCDEESGLKHLRSFADDVGSRVHHLDRNHLVSLGAIAGYSGSGSQWCGSADRDFRKLMASPGTDVCDYHDYGFPMHPMGRPLAPNLTTALHMCQAVGKPVMVGETGIYADDQSELAPRADEFRAKLSAQFQAGVVGELLWDWAVKPEYVQPDADPDYGICPGDPSLGVLKSF